MSATACGAAGARRRPLPHGPISHATAAAAAGRRPPHTALKRCARSSAHRRPERLGIMVFRLERLRMMGSTPGELLIPTGPERRYLDE